MQVVAKSRNLPISAQKLRVLTGGLVGQNSQTAMQNLANLPQKGAGMIFETIKSARANAEHNYKLSSNNLVLAELRIDQGSKLKRWRPRSRGMTSPIMHPKAHITVVLSDTPKTTKKSEVKK